MESTAHLDVVTESSSEFKDNTIILDSKLRHEILTQLANATKRDVLQRLSYAQLKGFFKDLQVRFLVNDKVALIDIQELLASSDLVFKLFSDEINDIWFLDRREKSSNYAYWSIQRLLESLQIDFGKYIFRAPGAKLQEVVACIPQLMKNMPGERTYELVTSHEVGKRWMPFQQSQMIFGCHPSSATKIRDDFMLKKSETPGHNKMRRLSFCCDTVNTPHIYKIS